MEDIIRIIWKDKTYFVKVSSQATTFQAYVYARTVIGNVDTFDSTPFTRLKFNEFGVCEQ